MVDVIPAGKSLSIFNGKQRNTSAVKKATGMKILMKILMLPGGIFAEKVENTLAFSLVTVL
jgi:hypothetical protein